MLKLSMAQVLESHHIRRRVDEFDHTIAGTGRDHQTDACVKRIGIHHSLQRLHGLAVEATKSSAIMVGIMSAFLALVHDVDAVAVFVGRQGVYVIVGVAQ